MQREKERAPDCVWICSVCFDKSIYESKGYPSLALDFYIKVTQSSNTYPTYRNITISNLLL